MGSSKSSISARAREKNGRHSRSDQRALKPCSPAEVRRLRDAALIGLKDDYWGSMPGQLYLQGKIGAPQFSAARQWRELAGAYHEAIAAPPSSPRAASLERRGHSHPIDPDSEAGRREAEIHEKTVEEFNSAKSALLQDVEKRVSARFYLAFHNVIERDEALAGHEQFVAIDEALTRLAYHFGLLVHERAGKR